VSYERQRTDFLLLGGREPIVLDPETMRRRMREPRLAALLDRFGFHSVEEVLAGFEAPAAAPAAVAPHGRHSDGAALLETRVPRFGTDAYIDFAKVEAGLTPATPALPPLTSPVDVSRIARLLLENRVVTGRWGFGPRLERLLGLHGEPLDPVLRGSLL